MTTKQLGYDQGDALATPERDIFPFMLLPAEIRIKIYNITTSDCVCIPYRPRWVDTRPSPWPEDDPSPIPPHVKVLLQVKQIREDMLPHLHLAWVGGWLPHKHPGWDSFKHSAIPCVSRLTIGVNELFQSDNSFSPIPHALLGWMRRKSEQTSRCPWNLRHLTLIEGSSNWPGNPLGINSESHGSLYQRWASMQQTPETARQLAETLPIIQELQSLNLVLAQQISPVFLDMLSKRCEAHGIDLKVTVKRAHPGIMRASNMIHLTALQYQQVQDRKSHEEVLAKICWLTDFLL